MLKPNPDQIGAIVVLQGILTFVVIMLSSLCVRLVMVHDYSVLKWPTIPFLLGYMGIVVGLEWWLRASNSRASFFRPRTWKNVWKN